MGRSSLLGIRDAEAEAPGHDNASLGPGDSSDSGSDMVGIEDMGDGDPSEPVDVTLGRDLARPLMAVDSLGGATSDRAGSGERRSAGDDGGMEAADISVDRVFSLGQGGREEALAEPQEALRLAASEAVLDDEADDQEAEHLAERDLGVIARRTRQALDDPGQFVENEAADPVGDGHSDAALAAELPGRRQPLTKKSPRRPKR